MLKIKRLIILILKYIVDVALAGFGLVALLGAGNTATFIIGLFLTIISLGNYIEKNW